MSSFNFLLSQHFFWYFIPQHLVNGCSDSYKTYCFLKELDEVFQMDINKLLRFRFLAEININLQKIHYCWQSIKTITQDGKKETYCCPVWYLFLHLKNVNGSHFWSFLVCNIPWFWRWKLWDQTFVSFNSGNIHIKESKKLGFTFSLELRTKICLISRLSYIFV